MTGGSEGSKRERRHARGGGPVPHGWQTRDPRAPPKKTGILSITGARGRASRPRPGYETVANEYALVRPTASGLTRRGQAAGQRDMMKTSIGYSFVQSDASCCKLPRCAAQVTGYQNIIPSYYKPQYQCYAPVENTKTFHCSSMINRR